MNNDQNNINQPNVQPNLGNAMNNDNRLVSNNQSMPAAATQPTPAPSPQPMPATQSAPVPVPTPSVAPAPNPVPVDQAQPVVQQAVPTDDNLTGTPVQPSEPKKDGGGKGIIIIVLIIVLVIAAVGFFIGKSMIDSENGNNSAITDKKAKDSNDNDDEEKKIDYNGVVLFIPNGYAGELKEDSGVFFKTSDKAYSIDFYDETVGDLDSSLIQMGADSKGNKKISGIEFNLYSYTKASKTEIIYVVDTSKFRIVGFAVNSSFVYNENILKDIVTSIGVSSDNLATLTPSSAVKAKFSSKLYSKIYEFEEKEK